MALLCSQITLFITGIIDSCASKARKKFATVWAWIPYEEKQTGTHTTLRQSFCYLSQSWNSRPFHTSSSKAKVQGKLWCLYFQASGSFPVKIPFSSGNLF